MTVKEFYNVVGGEYEIMLERLMTDELIKRFLLKFVKEPSYDKLFEAVETGTLEEAFMAAHTFKGVVSNLCLTKLHGVVSDLTEQLRPGKEKADEKLLDEIRNLYQEVIINIEQL